MLVCRLFQPRIDDSFKGIGKNPICVEVPKLRISLRKLNCICFVMAIIFAMTVEIKYLDAFSFPSRLDIILVLLFSVTGIMIELHGKIQRTALKVLLLIAFYLLIYGVATFNTVVNFVLNFFIFFIIFFLYAYFLQVNDGFFDLLDVFVSIVTLIGCITVFFWLFGSVLNILPGRRMMTLSWAGRNYKVYSYYFLYFENPFQNIEKLLGSTLTRNCGIFTEAPAYSGLLLLAIGIELFAKDKINKKTLIPLLITILTVQSTKGFVVLIVLLTINYVTKESVGRSRTVQVFRLLFSIIIIVGSCFALWYIIDDKSGTYSYAARMNHLVSGIRTWLQNPLFGVGFGNKNALVENQENTAGYGHLSMGIVVLLAYGGLYMLAFYAFAFFFALKNPKIQNRKRGYLMYSLLLLLDLFISNSAFRKHYLFMIAAAYAAGALGTDHLRKPRRIPMYDNFLQDKEENVYGKSQITTP